MVATRNALVRHLGHSRKSTSCLYLIVVSILFTIASNLFLFRKASVIENAQFPHSQVGDSKPTLIIQLRGEMGNHLSSIAHGMGFYWYAKEIFGMELDVLLRHQTLAVFGDSKSQEDSPKWKPTRDHVQRCFPNLRDWNFDRGADWKEFWDSERQQNEWLPLLTRNHLHFLNGRPWMGGMTQIDDQPVEFQDWNKTLTTLQSLWQRADRPASKVFSPLFSFRDESDHAKVSIPFLQSESLENTLVIDNFFDRLKKLFAFDFDQCCGEEIPQEDETVFHFRNFATEMPKFDLGLKDVSPNQTANVLLRHLRPGDKVAITTRFINQNLEQQVQALRARGLQVRVITGQSGVEDFCFLLRSKKEMVGNYLSSFALWAGILGQARSLQFYTVDSPILRSRNGFSEATVRRRFLYNWTHPLLSERIKPVMISQDNTN